MFPAQKRLTKKEDLKKVFKKGKYFSGDSLAIKVAKNGLSETRFSFLAGKKFFRKAVLRNKAKRTIRETIRPFLKTTKSGFDVVFFYRKNKLFIGKEGLIEANNEVCEILRKANLLTGKNK